MTSPLAQGMMWNPRTPWVKWNPCTARLIWNTLQNGWFYISLQHGWYSCMGDFTCLYSMADMKSHSAWVILHLFTAWLIFLQHGWVYMSLQHGWYEIPFSTCDFTSLYNISDIWQPFTAWMTWNPSSCRVCRKRLMGGHVFKYIRVLYPMSHREPEWKSLCRMGVPNERCEIPHSEHRFPAPSSKLRGLVMPLKGHSLSPRSCPPTRSAPSERFRTDKTVEATKRPSTHINTRRIHPG